MTTVVTALDWIGGLGADALELLARVAAVFATAWVVAAALRTRAAATRAGVWAAAFAVSALMPIAAAWLPPFGWQAASAPEVGGADALAFSSSPVAAELRALALDGVDVRGVAGASAAPDAAVAPTAAQSSDGWFASVRPRVLGGALLALWAAVAAARWLRLGRGIAAARRVVREAYPATPADVGGLPASHPLPRGVRVVLSDAPAAPFVLDVAPSVGRAVVVLSTHTGASARAAVWQHERAHVLRRDGLVLLGARVVAALYWPCPLIASALLRLASETERACDDAVLRGGVRASDLAATLVALAPGATLPVPAMGARAGFVARIDALLRPGVSRAALGRRGAAGIAAAAVTLAAPLAAFGPVAQGPLPESPPREAQDPRVAEPPARSAAAEVDAARRELLARGLSALVAQQDAATGAWRGDVGFKLNSAWNITAADVPHVGATALAVEALALSGVREGEDPHGRALARGVAFLLGAEDEAGYITAHGTRMREHALALRALAFVLAVAEPERPAAVREALERGVMLVAAVQNEHGGWRFTPNAKDSDLIETTYQIGALSAARLGLARVLTVAEAAQAFQRLDAPLRRARAHVADCWTPGSSQRPLRGFRFQLDANSRHSLDTSAAGLLATAWLGGVDGVTWADAASVFERDRAESDAPGGWPARHFLAWEADLAASRAFELVSAGGEVAEADVARRNAWRAQDLARLRALEAEGGGWTCDVGPGAAYFTAAACVRLAGLGR